MSHQIDLLQKLNENFGDFEGGNATAKASLNLNNSKLADIHAKSWLTSSMFSSMFGQPNNDLVRSLRLREKNIVADVLKTAIRSQFCFFKNLNPGWLSEIQQNGFVRMSNLMSRTVLLKLAKILKAKPVSHLMFGLIIRKKSLRKNRRVNLNSHYRHQTCYPMIF